MVDLFGRLGVAALDSTNHLILCRTDVALGMIAAMVVRGYQLVRDASLFEHILGKSIRLIVKDFQVRLVVCPSRCCLVAR
jgi:hypothetical protein